MLQCASFSGRQESPSLYSAQWQQAPGQAALCSYDAIVLLTSPQPVAHSRSLISLHRQLRRRSRSSLLLKEQQWVFLHPLKGWKKYKVTPRYREVAAGDLPQTAFYLAAGLGALDLETADAILVFLGFGQGSLGTSYPTCRL